MAQTERNGLAILEFADPPAWEFWLDEHHASASGVWLKLAKRGAAGATVTYAQALEVALCFGWIDGQKAALDESFWLQRFTARGPRSRWSQINRQKATELIELGRMRPAGLAQVDAARADGRWAAAYEPQSRATVPPDLQAALDAEPEAKAFFETLTGAARYAFCYRLTTVKRPETRARRIARYVELLRAGRTLHDR
jgi:uncharacterized protein YdeI (YjbR/CyaY-like superfamily)